MLPQFIFLIPLGSEASPRSSDVHWQARRAVHVLPQRPAAQGKSFSLVTLLIRLVSWMSALLKTKGFVLFLGIIKERNTGSAPKLKPDKQQRRFNDRSGGKCVKLRTLSRSLCTPQTVY